MDSLCSSLRRVPAPSLAGGRLPDLVPLRSRSLVPIAIFPQLQQIRPNFGSQIEWNRMKCGTVIVPSAYAPSLFRGSSPQDGLTLEQVCFHDPGTSLSSSTSCRNGVPVFVMLPLDTVHLNSTLNTRIPLDSNFQALKAAGVEGIMTDVWWGVVEKDAPGHYNWFAYRKLFNLAKKHGLKVQAVMSFHQCGGNVGDNCFIPLPRWAIAEIDKNPDIVYTDRSRSRNYEYLSLGCDDLPVLQGRSPVQAYADFMASFRKTFQDLLGDVIVEIQVGMGPAGELRYPAYPQGEGRWSFPGIGEFQCYDRFMMSSLQAAAAAAGRPEWGYAGPHDAGTYNQLPQDTGFFHNDGSWTTPYGHFFLDWYSGMLIGHGDRVLSAARAVFAGTGAHISGKVAGVHWHYGSRSHAAELTAGYYNTRSRDGYRPVAEMFARHGAGLNFTCVEMRDTDQPAHLQCGPEGLLRQVAAAAEMAGLEVSGENALPRFDQDGYDHIVWNAVHRGTGATMRCFTFLRMCEELFQHENWHAFAAFVKHMQHVEKRPTSWRKP